MTEMGEGTVREGYPVLGDGVSGRTVGIDTQRAALHKLFATTLCNFFLIEFWSKSGQLISGSSKVSPLSLPCISPVGEERELATMPVGALTSP
jgi:hypothetical protein